jgi:hypothetical protein
MWIRSTTHLQQQEVNVNTEHLIPRNPVVAAFGNVEVKRHQVHQDKRRRVKHRDRIFLRDEDG